jgi:hypothetical protein
LGTGNLAPGQQKFRPFAEAREFARSLGLRSEKEWRDYAKSEQFPSDIPVAAHAVYADCGWAGFGDWLGTGYRFAMSAVPRF